MSILDHSDGVYNYYRKYRKVPRGLTTYEARELTDAIGTLRRITSSCADYITLVRELRGEATLSETSKRSVEVAEKAQQLLNDRAPREVK